MELLAIKLKINKYYTTTHRDEKTSRVVKYIIT